MGSEMCIRDRFITHSVSEAVDIAQRILVFGRPGCLITEIDCEENRAVGKSTHEIEQLIRKGLRVAHETMPTEEVDRADDAASKERESI